MTSKKNLIYISIITVHYIYRKINLKIINNFKKIFFERFSRPPQMKKFKYFYWLVQNKVTVKWHKVASKVLPDTFPNFHLMQVDL